MDKSCSRHAIPAPRRFAAQIRDEQIRDGRARSGRRPEHFPDRTEEFGRPIARGSQRIGEHRPLRAATVNEQQFGIRVSTRAEAKRQAAKGAGFTTTRITASSRRARGKVA